MISRYLGEHLRINFVQNFMQAFKYEKSTKFIKNFPNDRF